MSIPSPNEIIARANDIMNVDKKKEYNINLCKKLISELQDIIVRYPDNPQIWKVFQVKKKEDFLIWIRWWYSYDNYKYPKMKDEATKYYDEVEVKKVLTDAGYTVTTIMSSPIISECCFPSIELPSLENYCISVKKQEQSP
jgi:hypothetical protein